MRQSTFYRIVFVSVLAVNFSFLGGCRPTSFGGTAKTVPKDPKSANSVVVQKTPSNTSTGEDPNRTDQGSEEEPFPGTVGSPSPTTVVTKSKALVVPFASSHSQRYGWIVTTQGKVFRVDLNADSQYATVEWKIEAGGGSRTFVSEIGLIVGKNGGKIFRVDEDVPAGSMIPKVWQADDADDSSRTCVTSFLIDGVPFVGAAYTAGEGAGAQRRFVRFPVDRSKPNKIDISKAKAFDAGSGTWGYSCYIDQARGHFWSGHGGTISGINVSTGQILSTNAAPNGAHISDPLPNFTFKLPNRASYAMSGDPAGNLLNGVSNYTYAYEPVSKTVFGSSQGAPKITVTDAKCFSSIRDCTGKHFSYDQNNSGAIGPMSSLNDGRVLGIMRGQVVQMFIIALKNPADPSQGLDVTKIKELPGDAYMYTDFTGATLYAARIQKTVELVKIPGFVKGKNVSSVRLRWNSLSGAVESWRGLKLKARCYLSGAGAPPAFFEVQSIPSSGTEFKIESSSCAGKIDSFELSLEGENGQSAFVRTKDVEISVWQ